MNIHFGRWFWFRCGKFIPEALGRGLSPYWIEEVPQFRLRIRIRGWWFHLDPHWEIAFSFGRLAYLDGSWRWA